MSPLEILQLVGYSTAAALHVWIAAMLGRRRRTLGEVERVLLPLAASVGVWHASNFVVTLHAMLGLVSSGRAYALRAADTLAVVSVTLTYSLLLHLHLHLWARARKRPLTGFERKRVYLSYLPALFLAYAVPRIWSGAYEPMFVRLSGLVLPFALWAAYVLTLVAVTDFLIARLSDSKGERRLMLTLAASFVSLAALILFVHALGVGAGGRPGVYLQTLANLGSLLPTALLAYHIYRYRYLGLALKESLIVASFASVVLVVYLYGIRTASSWATDRFGLRAAAVEALLILALALVASPLRRWLDRRFRRLFAEETALYRDLVRRVGGAGVRHRDLPDLLSFVEQRTAEALGLRRVRFVLLPSTDGEKASGVSGAGECDEGECGRGRAEELLSASRAAGWAPVEGPGGEVGSYEVAFPVRREDRETGLMLVDAEPEVLTHDVRGVLEMLAAQVAVAVEDSRLIEENVGLARKVAESERLASLGRMAATVAHEVKNPLSAIKTIAQVMREDSRVRDEYGRDLDLIVGETDRLARSVTQMLSFAGGPRPEGGGARADEVVRSVARLLDSEARSRGVSLSEECSAAGVELDGRSAAALRDAATNLLLNALQATPAGGAVTIHGRVEGGFLVVRVEDTGGGVPAELTEKIWEPFFTTKQRGTGLGLAIVRRRLEEVGGSARLGGAGRSRGASFEIRVPHAGADGGARAAPRRAGE